jgi:hypothetical protein
MKASKIISSVIILWLCGVACSFLVNLESSYSLAYAEHREANNRLLDCKLPHFAARYPKDCARVILEPPGIFLFSWSATALSRVNYCGPVSCGSATVMSGLGLMTRLYFFGM